MDNNGTERPMLTAILDAIAPGLSPNVFDRADKRAFFATMIAGLNTLETKPFNALPAQAKRWYMKIAYLLPDLGGSDEDVAILRALPWPDDAF